MNGLTKRCSERRHRVAVVIDALVAASLSLGSFRRHRAYVSTMFQSRWLAAYSDLSFLGAFAWWCSTRFHFAGHVAAAHTRYESGRLWCLGPANRERSGKRRDLVDLLAPAIRRVSAHSLCGTTVSKIMSLIDSLPPNHALQPTPGGAFQFRVAVDISPAWLSLGR